MAYNKFKTYGFKFINDPQDPETEAMTNNIINAILLVLALFILSNSFATLSEGEKGVRTRLGRASDHTIGAGLYFKIPFVDDIKKFDVRTQKRSFRTASYTKDVQTAQMNVVLSFSLDPAHVVETYRTYGMDWENRLIVQNLEQVLKTEIGKWDAVSLIANRDIVAGRVFTELRDLFEKKYPVRIEAFQITDISYSDSFEKAIEAKVIAVERANEAENRTRQIQEEANQKLISSRAEAESMRIRANALAQNRALVEYEAVQRWDGKLPQYMMGNSVPFIGIGGK
ncbi:MAG: prohibitin family protein [Alphaproteobacteria bacterium]|nr:prohibitin family protein [Alphaproteobacteria bacterium]